MEDEPLAIENGQQTIIEEDAPGKYEMCFFSF